ncbi:MAG: pyridoxamine 5'-phosphate oxidase family protein [Actinomycetales bacterium]|nr:pyridoxamine 5'-phosphate oxidase family protein [Actinomycetales bacterium]
MAGELTGDLTVEECWARLGERGVGRLAVVADDGILITPIDYLVHEGALYFRSAPGDKLAALAVRPEVALEAEGHAGHRRWTVLVSGLARRLDADDEIAASGVAELRTTVAGERDNFVRIDARRVTGRRFVERGAL